MRPLQLTSCLLYESHLSCSSQLALNPTHKRKQQKQQQHRLDKIAMSPASDSKMSLKLLVDNKAKKVLFAEAGKEFVDFVFDILRLHISDVARVVSVVGAMHAPASVRRLYKSVDDMAADYLLPSADKRDLLLRPYGRKLLAKMYTCPGRCVTVTVDAKAECPQCKQPMATEMTCVLPSSSAAPKAKDVGADAAPKAKDVGADSASDESRGFVKGLVTYMVTDGLEVTPITSSITLITRFSVDKDLDLAEKIVAVGDDEGLALIEAALRYDTVLSDVFLARKK